MLLLAPKRMHSDILDTFVSGQHHRLSADWFEPAWAVYSVHGYDNQLAYLGRFGPRNHGQILRRTLQLTSHDSGASHP